MYPLQGLTKQLQIGGFAAIVGLRLVTGHWERSRVTVSFSGASMSTRGLKSAGIIFVALKSSSKHFNGAELHGS